MESSGRKKESRFFYLTDFRLSKNLGKPVSLKKEYSESYTIVNTIYGTPTYRKLDSDSLERNKEELCYAIDKAQEDKFIDSIYFLGPNKLSNKAKNY